MINETIARLVPYLPKTLIKQVAMRYIAGETPSSAMSTAESLKKGGFSTTLDVLGEDIDTPAQAETAATAYVSLLQMMAKRDISQNVSLKLSQFGLKLSFELAFSQLNRVLDIATKQNVFVRIDMEDAKVTDLTLDAYDRARRITPNVGTVLQARLRRTIGDAERLAKTRARIRLCRGVYKENPAIAYEGNRNIHASFLETFRILTSGGCHVAVATHDIRLIRQIETEILKRSISHDQVEFQSLLGVPIARTLRRLRDDGYVVRLYVPFGAAWLPYSLRRLQENPELATAIVKGVLKWDHLRLANPA